MRPGPGRRRLRALAALAAATLLGAVASAARAASGDGALTVTDDTGATLSFSASPRRIVSLAPGATEMLFAAGAGGQVVATVLGADEPAAAKALPRIGDANTLAYEKLVALRPDVVVVWEDLTNRLVVDSLRKLKLPVYFIRARGLEDIPRSVRQLGRLAGTAAAADAAAKDLDRRIAALARRKVPGEPLRVFYMIWDDPLYTLGGRHVITDAIARCGGRNIFDDIAFPAPIVELEAVVKRDPDVMLLSAPPITARDWRERWGRYTTIRAVQTRQVLTFSDKRLDRMGPTAIDAVEGLCLQLDGARRALSTGPVTPASR
ncbi:MAG: cobalamin-binding protein [Steroidobacteraceae bacterium]|jgi:iron complex transport system substrate-binding protein|nr:cobalamin-binding protein [Steroidobacteraceae bacterium]